MRKLGKGKEQVLQIETEFNALDLKGFLDKAGLNVKYVFQFDTRISDRNILIF